MFTVVKEDLMCRTEIVLLNSQLFKEVTIKEVFYILQITVGSLKWIGKY